jgi:hypothetical protein
MLSVGHDYRTDKALPRCQLGIVLVIPGIPTVGIPGMTKTIAACPVQSQQRLTEFMDELSLSQQVPQHATSLANQNKAQRHR